MAAQMTRSSVAIIATALLLVPIDAASFLRVGQVSERDAERALSSELAEDHAERVAAFEDALRPTFNSLPKNERGHLSREAVRYVLHRLFVQRHGWYIKGLDSDKSATEHFAVNNQSEWVPSLLQARIEERSGEEGAGLHELAAEAAALEDLVRQETIQKLHLAYSVHDLPEIGAINREQAADVMFTYYMSFLIANRLSAKSPNEIHKKQKIFVGKFKDWDHARKWFDVNIMNIDNVSSLAESYDFNTTSSLAVSVGEKYHTLNDKECKNLKSALMDIESAKAGRVQLSAFYNASWHSHWRFTDKAEYLRKIGALDESNATNPHVIVPNYVTGRMNCLESSGMYSLCCRNECEDLMGSLERDIGAPDATPERILELVSSLRSDTVAAPRALSENLRSRLMEVADGNGGRVLLHGRLFAQWMHHAYPRECPYPHESGTTEPVSPNEWREQTGQKSTASEEEMTQHVESCPVEYGGSSELPWSSAEEHFAPVHPCGSSAEARSDPAAASARVRRVVRGIFLAGLVAVVAALATGWHLQVQPRLRTSKLSGLLDGEPEQIGLDLRACCRLAAAPTGIAALMLVFLLMDLHIAAIATIIGVSVLLVKATTTLQLQPKKLASSCSELGALLNL